MTIPLRNMAYEKIKNSGSLTDEELAKSLAKDGITMPADRFNKMLLDLEITGLITVTWFTKDARKIEVVAIKENKQEEEQMRMREKEYEASFPRADI